MTQTILVSASLTEEVADSAVARRLVREAVELAHGVDARVMTSDVQSAAQRDILAELGCDEGQGPVFAAARPPAAFRRALAE